MGREATYLAERILDIDQSRALQCRCPKSDEGVSNDRNDPVDTLYDCDVNVTSA